MVSTLDFSHKYRELFPTIDYLLISNIKGSLNEYSRIIFLQSLSEYLGYSQSVEEEEACIGKLDQWNHPIEQITKGNRCS